MSAEIHRLSPAGLRYAKGERGRPRHSPPLCFPPRTVSAKEDGEDSPLKTTTVELAQKTSQKMPLYAYDGVKTFLMIYEMRGCFLAQQETRKMHDIHDNANDLVTSKLDAIPDGTNNKKELAMTTKKLKDL